MYKALRRVPGAFAALLVLGSLGFGASAAQAQMRVPARSVHRSGPAGRRTEREPRPSITITLTASPGATSYNIYRSTTSGAEGNTPYATTTATTYIDKNLSSTPIYFYEFTAVNSCGESARTPEDASKTPPPQAPAATSQAWPQATA